MAAKPLNCSPAFEECLQGLRELHRLTTLGRLDSPEADEVRDDTDKPWLSLTSEEKNRLASLSEDLYSITDPPRLVVKQENPQFNSKKAPILAARDKGEWDKYFDLLRRWADYFDPALLSYLRGSALLVAGDPATALLFFEHASRLAPDSSNYFAIYLDTLRKVEPVAASALAEGIIADPANHTLPVLAHAVNAQFDLAKALLEDEANHFFEHLIPILSTAKSKIGEPAKPGVGGSTYSMICALLGFSYEFLGRMQDALKNYTDGLKANPDNDALLVARGILLYGNAPSAVDDFRKAIGLRTPLVWPRLFLAHHYVTSGLFEQCRVVCEQALQMPISDGIKSELSDWLAISQSELGFPIETVRALFDRAIAYDPSNERARRNLAAFQAATQPIPRRIFETPSSRDIRDSTLRTRRLNRAA